MKRHLPSSFNIPLRTLPIEGASPDRPLRMAVDLSIMPPGGESGGVKPFVIEYLRQLAALEGDRLVLIFLTGSASHAEVRLIARPQDELVCVRHIGSEPINQVGNWRNGERLLLPPPLDLLLQLEVDLFYSPLGLPQFACPGIPTISTIVDVLHRDYPSTLSPQHNAVREDLFRELVKICDRFQCISQYSASRLHEHFAVPLEQTFCSHIPIHHRLESTEAGTQPPLISTPYFFYPANSWKHKNHETLLVAYHHYRAHHTAGTWDLVLTGHDDERMRQILAVAENLGIREHVHFFGHLPDHEFTRVWRHAGAMVFPSLHEGFGIPLVEAMHFGVPIVCSTAGSLPEVAGNAALFVDARDPVALASEMSRMASDEKLREELIVRGRKRLLEFSLTDEISEFREAVFATAAGRFLRPWTKGLHPDGWMEGLAILGLPAGDGLLRIKLRVGPNPVARRLRVYVGQTAYGGFDIPEGIASEIELEVDSKHRSLVLEIPDAKNLSPDDHRTHGIILTSAGVTNADGQVHDLLGAKS